MNKHNSKLLGFFMGAALALCPGWAAAGEAPPAGAVPVPQFVSQTTVNNPLEDTTAADDVQANTSIVDLGGGKLVAAFDDLGAALRTGSHWVGYSWSNTGGVTWTDAGSLPANPGDDGRGPILAANTATGYIWPLKTPLMPLLMFSNPPMQDTRSDQLSSQHPPTSLATSIGRGSPSIIFPAPAMAMFICASKEISSL